MSQSKLFRPMITREGEPLSHYHLISQTYNLNQLFISHERLEPGHRASSPHRHSYIEEVVFVHRGVLTVVKNDSTISLASGESHAFLPDDETFHYLLNTSSETAEYLIISINREHDQTEYLR